MIQVHHLNESRSQRILWLLEELGLPYEVVKYERDAQTRRAAELLQEQEVTVRRQPTGAAGRVTARWGAPDE